MPTRSIRSTAPRKPKPRGRPPRQSPPQSASPQAASAPGERPHGHWTFLSNHAHVLILLARDSSLVLREVATRVGITERAVQRIIADLESEGFIEREKIGRRNHYRIRTDLKLRHPIESHRTIGDLISLVHVPDANDSRD